MVNYNNPLLYEHLSLIIDEYEKAALNSGKREAILAVSQSTFSSMDFLLASSEHSLLNVKDTRKPTGKTPEQAEQDLINIDMDADVTELFANNNNPIANYVQECLGCDFRLQFDWQLKPLNLLGGIENMLNQIKASLDSFEFQLDPLKSLDKVCELLNSLKGLCLPDIIIILLSLKMLLKKYLNNAFNMKIDWTTIVGPLLKAIVEGITKLMENLAMVLLAPLDCIITNIKTAKSVENAITELNPKNIFANFNATGEVSQKNLPRSSIVQEYRVTANTTLQSAIEDPNFRNSDILNKSQAAVQEARNYIQGLLGQILKGLQGIEALVGNGFTAQLNNLGIILFLQDLISLIMVIINLMKSKTNVTDWCSVLEENPEILQNAIQARYNPGLTVQSLGDGLLHIYKGTEFVSEIKTCSKSRSESDRAIIDQWIAELNTKGI